MGNLHKKVIGILKAAYPDVLDGLETAPATKRITGWIASSHFEDLGDRARQDKLWKLLKSKLTAVEIAAVGPIVAMTLNEAETYADSGEE